MAGAWHAYIGDLSPRASDFCIFRLFFSETEITYCLSHLARRPVWPVLCLLGDVGTAYELFLLRLGSWGLGVCFGIVAAPV